MGRHRRDRRPATPLASFAAVHRWPLFAVPVLIALTVVTVLHLASPTSTTQAAAAEPASGGAPAATRTTVTVVTLTPTVTVTPVVTASLAIPDVPTSEAPGTTTSPPSTTTTPACTGNTAGQLIVVSISQQRAWMCQADHEVRTTPVTTGNVAAGDATPTGTWTIQNKQTDRYLVGPGYRDFVHYWMPFFGNYGFHDATWQTFPFGSPDYRTDGSHGCVHVPTSTMAWLYGWATPGTTRVTIQT